MIWKLDLGFENWCFQRKKSWSKNKKWKETTLNFWVNYFFKKWLVLPCIVPREHSAPATLAKTHSREFTDVVSFEHAQSLWLIFKCHLNPLKSREMLRHLNCVAEMLPFWKWDRLCLSGWREDCVIWWLGSQPEIGCIHEWHAFSLYFQPKHHRVFNQILQKNVKTVFYKAAFFFFFFIFC